MVLMQLALSMVYVWQYHSEEMEQTDQSHVSLIYLLINSKWIFNHEKSQPIGVTILFFLYYRYL